MNLGSTQKLTENDLADITPLSGYGTVRSGAAR